MMHKRERCSLCGRHVLLEIALLQIENPLESDKRNRGDRTSKVLGSDEFSAAAERLLGLRWHWGKSTNATSWEDLSGAIFTGAQ